MTETKRLTDRMNSMKMMRPKLLAVVLFVIGVFLSQFGADPAKSDKHIAKGKLLFEVSCGTCHQFDGKGAEGIAPTLVGCDWVIGPEDRLVRIALYGVRGPITVKGKQYNLEMPGLYYYQFEDEQMSQVLSYIRQAWKNNASPVSAKTVAKIRKATGERDSWTVEELKKACSEHK